MILPGDRMINDRAVTAGEREDIYRFLSTLCLRPPSDALISMIREGSVLSSVEDEGPYMRLFVDQSREAGNLKDELESEHTAIFVLPSGVLPHESVYVDKNKRLGGRATINVGKFYEKAGAELLDSSAEMPDHLGMELEFMGFLCGIERELWEKERGALQECIEIQKAFLEEHLLKWVHPCCEKIMETATYGFYKAIAHFTIEFMKAEEVHVAELHAELCEVEKGNKEWSNETTQAL